LETFLVRQKSSVFVRDAAIVHVDDGGARVQ
jgi:hypothetical protein